MAIVSAFLAKIYVSKNEVPIIKKNCLLFSFQQGLGDPLVQPNTISVPDEM